MTAGGQDAAVHLQRGKVGEGGPVIHRAFEHEGERGSGAFHIHAVRAFGADVFRAFTPGIDIKSRDAGGFPGDFIIGGGSHIAVFDGHVQIRGCRFAPVQRVQEVASQPRQQGSGHGIAFLPGQRFQVIKPVGAELSRALVRSAVSATDKTQGEIVGIQEAGSSDAADDVIQRFPVVQPFQDAGKGVQQTRVVDGRDAAVRAAAEG